MKLSFFRSRFSASTAALTLLAILGVAQPSPAQFPAEVPESSPVLYNAPPPPSGQGAPAGRRDGGASRGDCADYEDLAALVPVTDGIVWGQTTSAQPTLWFYLPTAVTPETPVELVVQDAADNFLYSTTLAVDADRGSLAIALPDTVTLPLNEPHYWTFSIYCDPERPVAAVFVRGTIERVAVAGLESLSEMTPRSLEQAQAYANAGIWYDALTLLGEQRQLDETDVQSQYAWETLLQQVNLERAADAPVLLCCEPE